VTNGTFTCDSVCILELFMVSSEMASVMPQERGEGFLKEIGNERGYSKVWG